MSEKSTVRLGGKGFSLSSSTVYAIAAGDTQVGIDSSALDRLTDRNSQSLTKPSSPFPKTLTPEESRASLTVLLNKLLLSANSSAIRTALPVRITETLNSGSVDFELIELTEDESNLLERSVACLTGICAILDHKATALSSIVDAIAALSCEALKGNVTSFGSFDSGDGYGDKEAIGVANDLKVLLNGSKLVGKAHIESLSTIPEVSGKLREAVKHLHSATRSKLNSGVKGGKINLGAEQASVGTLSSLWSILHSLGNNSLIRAKLNLDSIEDESLRVDLISMLENCPNSESLNNVFKLAFDAQFEKDYIKFAHEVNQLLGIVLKIVAWEAVTAFVSLEGKDFLVGKGNESVGANEDVSIDKKKKKKDKKAVLGKGTGAFVQFIKDRLLDKEATRGDGEKSLSKWVDDLLLILDPKDGGFVTLLEKVKEVVESNDSRRLPKIPKGTRDFSKEQMAVREKAFSKITEVFKRHGAMALDTPVFELRETLTGKYGEDSKLIYDLADQGGELCSLRYDLTVPFARYVAMNGITSFKRYQIAKVYRRDNPSKGRYREFYQCDFDIAGQNEKMGPDFEVIKILTELLDELSIGDYEIKLNHRKLLDGMLEICGVPAEKFRTICSSIDKLDKQTFDQVKKEMVEEKGLSAETADKIGSFVKERGHPLELLSKLKQEGSEFLKNKASAEALDDLIILFEALEKSKCVDKVVFDLSLARGLDYYTGVIYEAVFKGGVQVGSIAAGGRYDNLIGNFGTKAVPAVGVSLGIERVFNILEDLQKQQNQTIRATETQVLVSIMADNKLPLAAELVSELWNAKINAEFLVSKRSEKHFDRTEKSKIPWRLVVREREGLATLNIMETETKKEEEVTRANFVEELSRRLNL